MNPARSVKLWKAGDVGWQAILFDLDGTLADTIQIILACYRFTMRVHLGRELPDGEWLATLGAPLRKQIQGFARSKRETQAMLSTYQAHQLQIHDDMVRAFPGVHEVVEWLANHIPLGVVTGKRRDIALRTLRCCGLDPYFRVVVTADDEPNGKPSPAPVVAALDGLGSTEARTVLFVGDSPLDVMAGRGAAVRTTAALWGAFPRDALLAARPDYLVSCAADVLSLPERTEGAGDR